MELTVSKLREALGDTPGLWQTDVLVKNDVGNLALIRDGIYIGFVDLRTGDIEIFERDDDGSSTV